MTNYYCYINCFKAKNGGKQKCIHLIHITTNLLEMFNILFYTAHYIR